MYIHCAHILRALNVGVGLNVTGHVRQSLNFKGFALIYIQKDMYSVIN